MALSPKLSEGGKFLKLLFSWEVKKIPKRFIFLEKGERGGEGVPCALRGLDLFGETELL